jgi:RNA polymerase sigma-70 factor, ECF subfamily
MTANGFSATAGEREALSGERERILVSAARSGDPEAFRELYQAYRGPIWTLVIYMLGDPLQAQDVLQNVFMKAFLGLKNFRFQSRFFTWIYRIALNECRNQRRKRVVPHIPLEAILGSRDEIDRTAAADGAEASRILIRDAVKRLPEKMREVVLLKYGEELSYEEMSGIIGCAPGTVASRLNRALAELEERLKPFKEQGR